MKSAVGASHTTRCVCPHPGPLGSISVKLGNVIIHSLEVILGEILGRVILSSNVTQRSVSRSLHFMHFGAKEVGA